VLPRRFRRPGEALLVVLAVLLVFNVRWPTGAWVERMAVYQGVYIGPTNRLLHGGTMLVDTFSQYGPGMTYVLAALFKLVPIDYGSFALTVTLLDVVLFLAIWSVLRLAGASLVITTTAVAVAAFTGIVTAPPASGGYTMVPNRPLRLIMPLLVVLAVQLAHRYPERRRLGRWAVAALVGFSSFWAAEVFVYTLATAVALIVVEARLDAPPGRALAGTARAVWPVAASIAAVQVAFNGITRIVSGSWPDWPLYVKYMLLYGGGTRSQMLAPFAPGLLLGVFYFVSAAACVALLAWHRPYVRERRIGVLSVCGVTAFAVAYYSYFVGQAGVFNVHKMAPVLVLLVALWLSLVDEGRSLAATSLRTGIGFVALWSTAAALIAKDSLFLTRLSHTALAAGPVAAIDDIRFAASSPAAFREVPQVLAFMRREMADVDRPLVLLDDALTTEVLLRLRTVGPLPIGDPTQDSYLPSRVAYLRSLAERLPVGTRFLTHDRYWRQSATLRVNQTNLQLLYTLRQTFVVRPVATGPGGLRIYRLEARR
jgi:hypothetical protein